MASEGELRVTRRPWLDETEVPPFLPGGTPPTAASTAEAERLPHDERRAHPRRAHRVFQWIAPCVHGKLPDRSAFFQVQCVDISRGGIAFLTDAPLPCKDLIIALGTTEDAFYVRSQVRNCTQVRDEAGLQYRYGCEFIERYGGKPAE